MVGSAYPRSLDRKKRIMGMASRITRLVPLGLLFVGGGGHLKSLVLSEKINKQALLQPALQWQE